MEKRIQELEESVKALARYMKTEMAKVDKLGHRDHRAPIEGKVDMLSEEFTELKKLVEQNVRYNIRSEKLDEARDESFEKELAPLEERIERELDEDDVERLSVTKNISDVRKSVEDMQANLIKLNEVHEREKAVSKKIEEIASTYVTRELGNFAKNLDIKYPELATKHDFERFATEMRRNINMIEAPDMTHFDRKIADLERKMSKLISMIEDVYNRVPAVVE